MSFAEIDYPHQVVRVDLEGEDAVCIEPIPVPRSVQLLRVPAEPSPVEEALAQLASLPLSDLLPERRPYLQVRVALDTPEPRLRARVEAALEGVPIRLAKIETTLPHQERLAMGAAPVSLDDLGRFGPEEVFRRLHADSVGGEPPQELLTAFAELLKALGEQAQ
jgi:exonuclease SbcD